MNLFERLKPQQVKAIEQPHKQENHIAGTILRALRQARPDGLNRRAIFDIFDRNQNAAKLSAALDLLWKEGKVHRKEQVKTTPHAGPPAEIWFATCHD